MWPFKKAQRAPYAGHVPPRPMSAPAPMPWEKSPPTLTFDSLVVKPGDVVILKPRGDLSDEAVKQLRADCEAFSERSGVKFFVSSNLAWDLLVVPATGRDPRPVPPSQRSMSDLLAEREDA